MLLPSTCFEFGSARLDWGTPSPPQWWQPLTGDTFYLTPSNTYANPHKVFREGVMRASYDKDEGIAHVFWFGY